MQADVLLSSYVSYNCNRVSQYCFKGFITHTMSQTVILSEELHLVSNVQSVNHLTVDSP